MPEYEPDPLYRHARREALVLCVVFLLAFVYTLFVCSRFGYDRAPAEIVTYLGIPDWVMWGILLPWTFCVLATVWFCFVYMADDPLESDEVPEATLLESVRENSVPPLAGDEQIGGEG